MNNDSAQTRRRQGGIQERQVRETDREGFRQVQRHEETDKEEENIRSKVRQKEDERGGKP